MRRPVPFGRYLLLDRIAVGGMAEVFAAKTFGVEGFQRTVAIKRILPNMVEDEEFIAMFKDEARIAALLQHASIATIFDLGRHDETYFIAMDYVSGRDVRLLIDKFRKKNETVPLSMAAYIVARIADGLDYAHCKTDHQGQPLGIIHRDVSPQNVLVSYDGEVKLIDFGIAKAAGRNQKTQAGILKGKFAYMSPEQVRGIPIDYRSDIYSTGVILYEMLTGQRLFSGESDFSTLEKVRAGTVRAPSEINAEIPPELESIVLKALAKDRDERYQGGQALHDDLMKFLFDSGNVYGAKNLAGFMKETFADEYRKELERIRRWFDTKAEDDDFQPDTASPTTSAAQKVRVGERDEEREEADEPQAGSLDGQATQVRAVDNLATEVKPLEGMATKVTAMPTMTDGGTAIIRREDVQGTPAEAATGKRERTVMLDEREILASSRTPPRRSRRAGRALATIAAAAGVVILALGVVDLQLGKGQRGIMIVVKGPSTAQASVDGTQQKVGAGAFVYRSATPDHSLKVFADGYKPYEGTFSIAGDQPVEVNLVKDQPAAAPPTAPAPVPQPVVASAPAEQPAAQPRPTESHPEDKAAREKAIADLARLNNAPKQPAPNNRAPEPERVAQAAPVPAPAPKPPEPPPAPAKVSLSIATTNPPTAMVVIKINGKSLSGVKKTPVTIPDLAAGQSVEMRFAAPGFQPTTKQYTMTGSGDSVSVELAKVAAEPSVPGKLRVMCTPKAKIMVDEKIAGYTTPPNMTTLSIDPGHHTVYCESEVGKSTPKEVTIASGGEADYRARIGM